MTKACRLFIFFPLVASPAFPRPTCLASFPSRFVIGRSRGEAVAERRREELNRYIRHLTHDAPEVAEVGGLPSVPRWGVRGRGVGWVGDGVGGMWGKRGGREPPGGQVRNLALWVCLTLQRRKRGRKRGRKSGEEGGREGLSFSLSGHALKCWALGETFMRHLSEAIPKY